MFVAAMKTKERLVKECLKGRGIRYSVIAGVPFLCEEAVLEIPTSYGFGLMVSGEMPIMPFGDDDTVSDVLSCQISRVVAIEDSKRIYENTLSQNDHLRFKADEATGELVEFLKHIKNLL